MRSNEFFRETLLFNFMCAMAGLLQRSCRSSFSLLALAISYNQWRENLTYTLINYYNKQLFTKVEVDIKAEVNIQSSFLPLFKGE